MSETVPAAGNGPTLEVPPMLEVLPVRGLPDVRPGDDLAALIAAAAPWLRDGDVLVVTSKIVSKAEGRLVDVPAGGPEREVARDEILTAETARPVARRGNTRIVQTHHGFVMASAGIDASNVEPTSLVLLPKDPDASARTLRAALRERYGVHVGIVISDTMGRPWRLGLVDVALGAAGIGALRDYRGAVDPYGNELHITQMAVVDELASAAELVKGKCDAVPVVAVRGLAVAIDAPDGPGAAAMVRGADQDLFSLGTAEARALGLRDAATLSDGRGTDGGRGPDEGAVDAGALDSAAVARAVAAVGSFVTARISQQADTIVCRLEPPYEPEDLVALGVDVHRLRAALLAEGVESTWAANITDSAEPVATLRLRPALRSQP